MNKKSLISITDYSKEDIFKILDLAEEFQNNPKHEKLLENFVIASLFFEPSTRTRLSFESAIQKLGGKVVGFSEASNSSVAKGESLKDTILTVSNYSDLIIMRHPIEGSARYACDITSTPIINAGDGANQHPTQCLLDLYSIRKTQGTLENLNLYIVGDLKYGRTVHSLLMAMSDFNPTFNFVSPVQLRIPQEYKNFLNDKGLDFYEHDQLDENIKYADIIYVTRVQRERFSDPVEYEKVKNTYVLKNKMLENTKIILKFCTHYQELTEIDLMWTIIQKAYYFQQAENGVYARMALICHILGIK